MVCGPLNRDAVRLLDLLSDGALLLTLCSTGLAIGMSLARQDVLAPLRQTGLVARAVVLDVAVVPLLVWALVDLLSICEDYAIGHLLVGVEVPLGELLATLAVLVLLPLSVGMLVRGRSPGAARRWAPRAIIVSNISLVVVFALMLGWLAGGPGRPTRAAVALVTGVRANALALGTPATGCRVGRPPGGVPVGPRGGLRVGSSVEPQFHPHRMMSDPMPSHSLRADQAEAVRAAVENCTIGTGEVGRCALRLTGT